MSRAKQENSRRRFMKQAVLGAGATAATLGTGAAGLSAAEEEDAPPSDSSAYRVRNGQGRITSRC